MADNKPIFIYAEAPPLSENVVTYGLYRASTPILRAIRDTIDTIALFPWDRRFQPAMLDPQLAPLCTFPPSPFLCFRAVARRLPALNDPLIGRLAATWVSPKAARSFASHILCLEGSDPDALAHVAQIAARARKPFSVYVVDDFLTPMRLDRVDEKTIAHAAERARAALQQASNVFSISDGLGALFEGKFGIKTTTLPLVFEMGPQYSEKVKRQIIFVGSVNFLYDDSLRALIEDVGTLRVETGEDLTIRLTSPSAATLGNLPSYVHIEPLGTAERLAREISASLFAFLPYNFDVHVADMVRTSFPSKLMEYLAHARSIVAFTPPYANTTSYFRTHGLPGLANNREDLRSAIRRHLVEAPVYSDIYRGQLLRIHSPRAARQIILSALFGLES